MQSRAQSSKRLRNSFIAAGLTAVVVGCDHDIVDMGPREGSFAIDGTMGVLSSGSDFLVFSRTSAPTHYVIEARGFSGGLRWKYDVTPGEMAGRVALDTHDNLYFRTSTGITSLDKDGHLRWRTDLGPPAGAEAPSVAVGNDGRVYTTTLGFSNTPPKYYAVDGATGGVAWTVTAARDVMETLIEPQANTAYFIARGGATAVNTANGTVRWTFFRGGFDRGDAALAPDGTLYVAENADFSRRLNAIAPDGTLKWTYGLPPNPGGIGPLIDRAGNVYISTGSSFSQGALVSLSPSGSVNWTYSGVLQVATQGALDSEKTVYLIGRAGLDQDVKLLAIRNGAVVSTLDAVDGVFLDRDGRVYYGAGGRVLFFSSLGYESRGWSEQGQGPDRASRLVR